MQICVSPEKVAWRRRLIETELNTPQPELMRPRRAREAFSVSGMYARARDINTQSVVRPSPSGECSLEVGVSLACASWTHYGAVVRARARGIKRCWSFQPSSNSRKSTPVLAFGHARGFGILCFDIKPLTQPLQPLGWWRLTVVLAGVKFHEKPMDTWLCDK
jgi:hypothetical protein